MLELAQRFRRQCAAYAVSETRTARAWAEINSHYGHAGRYYHDLSHLDTLFRWFERFRERLVDAEAVAWSIWYHDIIYDARRRDNEERSALMAEQRLAEIGVSRERIATVTDYIRATARHLEATASGDLAWLLDFDLAILGADSTAYAAYAEAVRQEYAHVPGFFYRRGRRKVLRYFLAADQLYRTPELRAELAERARANLRWELAK